MNTKYKRFLSLVLAGALMVSCLTGCGSSAQGNAADQVSTAEADALAEAATSLLRFHGSAEGKEETVYVIADANGNPTRTIVSAWLKNPEEADTITDRSTLTGIENVKGSETYTTDANGDLVWQADGNDIYYQGSSDAPLPITANITYTLDGVDVTPELLEGATGHLVMTFHYINHTAAERVVNGKSVTLYQPFAVVSGAMLDNSKVSNVEVTNGKVINSGDQTIVVGLAMPGLKESLGLDELEDSDGNPVDIDVPESVTIEADVTDFSLLTTITIAENTLLDELDLEDVKTFDDLQEAMDELTDASTKLVDGTEELYDGAGDLKDGTNELADGAKALDDGAGDLKDGTKELADGASTLKDGTSELADGTGNLANGASALNTGAGQLVIGLDQLQTSVSDLPEGTTKLVNGAKLIESYLKGSIHDGLGQLVTGADKLLTGVDQLTTGAGSIAGGAQGIEQGAQQIAGAAQGIQQGAQGIAQGAQQIVQGAKSGDSSNPGIYEAAAAIQAGAKSGSGENPGIYEAASAIASGAAGLKSGLSQLPDAVAGAVASAVSQQTTNAVSALDQAASCNNTAKSALNDILDGLSEEDAQVVRQAIAAIDGSTAYINGVSGALSSPDTGGITSAVSSQLSDALDGLDRIATAANGIQSGATQIAAGAAGIQTGAEQLAQGAQAIAAGAKSGDMSSQDKYGIYEAAAAIARGAVSGDTSSQANYGIYEAAAAIEGGAKAISAGLKSGKKDDPGLYEGIDGIKAGAKALQNGVDTIASEDNLGALIDGLETLQGSSGTLLDGIGKLAAGADQLFGGTSDLAKGANRLDAGAQQLDSGAGQLADGARQLDDGARQLKGGTSKLLDGTGELTDGVDQLLDGAKELMDGMAEFDEDGIQKLSDLFQDDAQDLLDRLRALQEYSREYTSYSGASDAMPSQVRFIIRTESIGE